ncbi:GNAT family N-acetyltransferase [Bradyrhizobium viridifuturi]|uniref:GNAT family N-acetyltransferase n=1 Tax=Bradyrhizobium viridifuturi TaxID=1654716 RepID=UPI00067EE604|nr:GNAT family N-acetyltransferase [Bradyrhizobium viridifuturi]
MTVNQIRPAHVDDAAELTQIAARAVKNDGFDDNAVARFMPGLRVNLALIAAGLVFVAEGDDGVLQGWVSVRPTGIGGLILLEGIFVEPAHSRRGAGSRLFSTAVGLSRKLAGNVILINSSPSSVDFYARLGANKIGATPFVFSPDVELTMFAFTIPAV